jgi:O-antigen ligase
MGAGWQRTAAVAAIALLALSVVAFAPGSYFRWVLPKELVALLAVVLASLAVPAGRLGRAFWVIVGLGGIVFVVAALLGDDPLTQVLGAWPRYEGLVSVPVYVASAWAAARMLGPGSSADRIAAWNRWVAFASIALGVVTLFESWGTGPIATDLDRPGALLGNASDQGLVGAAFLFLLAIPTFRAATARGGSIRTLLLLGGGVVAAALTVVLSGSRGALLATGVGVIVGVGIVIARVVRQRGARAARGLLLGVGAGVAALAVLVLATPAIRDRLFALTASGDRTLADRELMWQQALDVVARNPWTGAGPSGFAAEAARGLGEEWYRVNAPGAVLDSPHDVVLQVLVAGGLPLLVIALAGFALVVTRFAQSWGRFLRLPDASPRGDVVLGAGVALLALLAGLLTHFTVAGTGILAGAIVGIIVARPTREREVEPPGVAVAALGAGRTILFGVWAVWMLVNVAADYRVADAVAAPTADAASNAFADASALRPWDAALPSIAAQILTAHADSGEPGASVLALEWADRAMTRAPGDVAPRIAHAVARRADGDAQGAARELTALHDEYPANPDITLQLGLAQAASGQKEAAIVSLREVLEVWPEEAAATRVLAELEG